MTEFSWAELRGEAIRRFDGELPNATTEAEIIETFEQFPASVTTEMRVVADAKASGQVRSGWAVLRKRLQGAGEVRDVVVTDESDRRRSVRRALLWIDRCGAYFDREGDLLEELFERGFGFAGAGRTVTLASFDSGEVREEVLARWGKARPIGERLEREQEEWLAAWRQWHTQAGPGRAVAAGGGTREGSKT